MKTLAVGAEQAAPAIPTLPPAWWFSNPELKRLTPLRVESSGRVYGHAAGWGMCHTGYPGECRVPPRGDGVYAYFLLGEVECDDGSMVPVGKITLDTTHPSLEKGWQAASRHYGKSGCGVADLSAGNDTHGIWVAGALRPTVTLAQIRELRASPLSGDWRPIVDQAGRQRLEMIALLAVNAPGFPIPRVAIAASGEPVGATGLGIVTKERVVESLCYEAMVSGLAASVL